MNSVFFVNYLDVKNFHAYIVGMDTQQAALNRAIDIAGGSGYALAKRLGLTRQAVYKWIEAGRVLSRSGAVHVEQETGVSRHELRPDLFGERV